MIRRLTKLSRITQADFIALNLTNGVLLMDVDNTLLSPYEKNISDESKQWVEQMSIRYKILLCTNNITHRQTNVGIDLNLPILMNAFKPFPWRVKKYLLQQNVKLNQVIVIGDQVITDVVLAIWLKRPYLLIKPMANDKHIVTRFFRRLESLVIQDE